MSKIGWEAKARGIPNAGLEMEDAIAPPTKACAVAVMCPFSISGNVNLRQKGMFDKLPWLCFQCFFP